MELLSQSLLELLRNTSDYMFVKDTDFVYAAASEAFAKVAGFSSYKDVIGKTDFDLFDEALASKYRSDDEQLMKTGIPVNGIIEELPEKDGRNRWTQTWKYVIRDEENHIIGMYGLGKDITQLKNLQDDKNGMAKVLGRIPGGISIFSYRGIDLFQIDYTNDGFYQTFNGSRSYYMGISENPINWILEDDRPVFMAEFELVKTGRKETGNATYRVIGEDGNIHWINHQFNHVYDENGVQYYYCSFACLDKQKEVEAENQNNRIIFETAISRNGISVFEYNMHQHTITTMNDYSFISGLKSGYKRLIENVPESLKDSVREESWEAVKAMYQALDDGAPQVSADVWFKSTKTSEPICEHISYTSSFDQDGRPVTAYGTAQNITAQKQYEKHFENSVQNIIRSNANVVAIFHLNLTKNTVGDGYSNIPNTIKLQNSGRADGFFKDVAESISDQKLAKQYEETINCRRLLEQYKQGVSQFLFEFPTNAIDISHSRWVETHYNLSQNPLNGDIEAITYSLDITSQKTDEIIVNHLAEEMYDSIALIYVNENLYYQRSTNMGGSISEGVVEKDEKIAYADAAANYAKQYIYPEDQENFLEAVKMDHLVEMVEQNGFYRFDYRSRGDGHETIYKRMEYRWLDESKNVIVSTQSDITEQHRQEVEDRLRREEAARADERIKNLEQVLESIPAGLAVYQKKDDQITMLMINDYLAELANSTKEAILTHQFDEQVKNKTHPDDIPVVQHALEELFSEKNSATFTYRVRGEYTKEYKWIKASGKAVEQPDGSKLAYIIYTDATNQKEQEDAFKYRITNLMAANPNALRVARLNITKNLFLDGQVALFDDENIMNSKTADDYFDNCSAAMSPATAAHCRTYANRENLLSIFEHGRTSISFDFRRHDTVSDEDRWATSYYNLVKNPTSGDLEAVVYTIDTNDSILGQKIISKITATDYEYMAVINVEKHLIQVMNIKDASHKVPQIANNYDELQKMIVNMTYGNEGEKYQKDLSLDHVVEMLNQEGYYLFAFSYPSKDGRQLRKQIKYCWLDEEKDTILLTQTDITDSYLQEINQMHQLETALHAAEQASVAKTEFLSRMSHEIRTPMNAIIGLDEIAMHEKNLSPTMEDHLQKIAISARFLLSLINDILDMSRIESGRMVLKNEPFSFEELITGINTIMYEQCASNNLEYECVLKSFTEETYIGDRTKLQQVLVNILGNSVKFTPAGGKIHFMIEQVSRTINKAKMRFEIADTGIGISEEFMPHLFEVFSQENQERTTKFGGTGLGLAISKNIVNLMNGSITVKSVKGIGTVFTVDVQLDLPPETQGRSKYYDINGLVPLYTLIVDDDVIICQHTSMLLKDAGMKADSAASGREAVGKVTDQHQKKADYDLILLDWKMPDMDGIETAREIRKIVGPEITIIIMTAYDWAEIENQAIDAGVNMFMRKPIFVSSVTKAFENVFRQKAEKHPEQIPEMEFNFKGKRVLIAEDNVINAEIAKTLLETKGCEVVVAGNGVDAIESFSSTPVGYFDIILMDIRMPIMDGLEATKAIRAMKKSDSRTIPIIAMTANAFQEDIDLSIKSGMNAHLAKPIETDVLYATIYKYLKK